LLFVLSVIGHVHSRRVSQSEESMTIHART
jgi:hypothetical protein